MPDQGAPACVGVAAPLPPPSLPPAWLAARAEPPSHTDCSTHPPATHPTPQQLFHPSIDGVGHVDLPLLRSDWHSDMSLKTLIYALNRLLLLPGSGGFGVWVGGWRGGGGGITPTRPPALRTPPPTRPPPHPHAPEDPINPQAGALLRQDRAEFEAAVARSVSSGAELGGVCYPPARGGRTVHSRNED